MNEPSTHVYLWLVLAFGLGTLWQPTVELLWHEFPIDNRKAE